MEVSRALKLFRMFCIMLAETKFPTASFLHQCFGLEEGVISEGTPGQLLSPEEGGSCKKPGRRGKPGVDFRQVV